MVYSAKRRIIKARTQFFEAVNRTNWKPFLKKTCPPFIKEHLRQKHIGNLAEFPTVFSIETTNNCNAKCWFCPTHKASRVKGFMEFSLFRKIIDELKPMSGRLKSVALFMDGEPTLHPELLEFLKYASAAGIKNVYLSSNMEYFTPELTDRIFKANLGTTLQYVMCSLDGARADIHRKNRIGVDFDTAVSNTLYLLERRTATKNLYPMVFSRLLVSDLTKDSVDEFKQYWTGKADKVLCYKMHNWGGMIKSKSLRLTDEDMDFTPCYFPFSQCAIQFDGTIRLCCVDCNGSVDIGNIKEDTIRNIVQSGKIKKIRQNHIEKNINKLPKICAECSYPRKGMWVAPFYW